MDSKGDRRTFLKVGAGVVAGAAIASVVEIPYYSSVIGGNNNSSSTTVASLQNQLATTQSQLNDTQSSLSSAQNTISSLNSQLSNTQNSLSNVQGSLSNAQSSLTAANSQNASLNQQLTATQGSLQSANGQVSSLQNAVASANGQITSLQSAVTSATTQSTALQVQIDTMTGFLTLATNEQNLLTAIAETIIPTDSNGPGANEAGVIYFIDRVLAGDYGRNANVYMQGPFTMSGLAGPVTVQGVTYTGGTPVQRVTAGTRYQYQMSIREFFRYGLEAFETYCTTAYGGNFETLTAANQLASLQDLWNNKPTTFNSLNPVDFAFELTQLVWAGFLMDPIYGGNRNMVGWKYVAFNGTNFGNFYGEGHTPQQLMVATTPTRLQPASLAQYQKGSP